MGYHAMYKVYNNLILNISIPKWISEGLRE